MGLNSGASMREGYLQVKWAGSEQSVEWPEETKSRIQEILQQKDTLLDRIKKGRLNCLAMYHEWVATYYHTEQCIVSWTDDRRKGDDRRDGSTVL